MSAAVAAAWPRAAGQNPATAAPSAQAPFERPTTLVVRTQRAEDLDAVQAMAAALGYAVLDRALLPPALHLAIPDGVSLARAVTDFTAKPGVQYAEPAYPVRAADVPADPLYAPDQSSYMEKMRAPEAWDLSTGAGVIVAVLDTGLDITHPDLADRVWTNTAEVPGNAVDDDANGCVDDVHGCAFLLGPSEECVAATGGNITDDVGHGTFVAGIIAASANGQGMVGVAPDATILPVKILDCTGNGNTFSLAQGILYAAARGARVLNISLGGPIDADYVREAIGVARARYGALLVAASGNNGGEVAYPARYDNVLAVGATTAAGDQRALFSNAGPEVDVVAIGVRVVGTVPQGPCNAFLVCLESSGYAVGNGTSFSAPIVSGLAALMLSRNPFLPPEALAGLIKSTADPMPPSDRPDWAGAGRINMLRALQLPFRLGGPGASRN
jgi:subtilisin family serine protease